MDVGMRSKVCPSLNVFQVRQLLSMYTPDEGEGELRTTKENTLSLSLPPLYSVIVQWCVCVCVCGISTVCDSVSVCVMRVMCGFVWVVGSGL